jgi:hypothetical protein
MKIILVALVGAALFAPAALAKHLHHARGDNASSMLNILPNNSTPTGALPGAPNRPHEYGLTESGAHVNPDEIPPLSPGGQGLAPQMRN